MNTKLAIPFLAILAFAQGCIINGHGKNPGDVTFSWTFYGQSCSAAGVASVHITIPGETLENGGVYQCVSNSYQGIVLHDFAGGSYTYSIEGLDTGGYTVYTGSGDFTIDGNVLESVDLTPYGQPGSYALVTWTFPGNVTCANADTPAQQLGGVAYVDITMDGNNTVRANCADGAVANGGQGVYSALVDPGAHTISLTALSSNLYPLFSASGNVTTNSSAPVADQVNLQWAVGGVVVSWTLQSNGGGAQTCLGTGNPYVYVNFVDSTNTAVYQQPGDTNTCNAAPTRYFYLSAAAGGTNYRIDLQAATNALSWSPTTNPVFTVMPGVFPADTSAVSVVLRQN
ncbi:MAG TPA: hypothetical protein VFA20_21210 [Myxococcaceae bacterium]|nr:hypothetical protein [Myxococcaceae bacterium]